MNAMTQRTRLSLLLAALAFAGANVASAQQTAPLPPGVSDAPTLIMPAPATPATTATAPANVRVLPPMQFYSSIGGDTLYDLLKADPSFAKLDKEMVGTPLFVVVTHSIKPTAGGSAAGALTAFLAGSTLGIIPVVTSEEFVVRYEIWLQGQPIASYSFNKTKTRAMNMWAMGADKYYGLGKDGMEWLKGTAAEFATKAATDPKLANVQAEIEYYFPPAPTAPTALAPPPAPPASVAAPAPAAAAK